MPLTEMMYRFFAPVLSAQFMIEPDATTEGAELVTHGTTHACDRDCGERKQGVVRGWMLHRMAGHKQRAGTGQNHAASRVTRR